MVYEPLSVDLADEAINPGLTRIVLDPTLPLSWMSWLHVNKFSPNEE